MDDSVNLQRGNCSRCKQTWVLGTVDPTVGEYGQFICAACFDETCDDDDDDDDYDDDDADSNRDYHDDCSGGGAPPMYSGGHRSDGFAVGTMPFARRKRKRDGAVAGAVAQPSVEEAGPTIPADFPTDGVKVEKLRVGLDTWPRTMLVVSHSVYSRTHVACGSSLWHGAKVLLKHLERTECRDPECFSGRRMLELGAGVGMPGVALAQLGAEVLLTDIPDLCPLLRLNVTANFSAPAPPPRPELRVVAPSVATLRWQSSEDLAVVLQSEVVRGGLDFIIGSDIGYDFAAFDALFATIRSLAAHGAGGGSARVVLAISQRPGEYDEFAEAARRAGWEIEVREVVDLPTLRGDPLCSPVAVLELRRAKSAA